MLILKTNTNKGSFRRHSLHIFLASPWRKTTNTSKITLQHYLRTTFPKTAVQKCAPVHELLQLFQSTVTFSHRSVYREKSGIRDSQIHQRQTRGERSAGRKFVCERLFQTARTHRTTLQRGTSTMHRAIARCTDECVRRRVHFFTAHISLS